MKVTITSRTTPPSAPTEDDQKAPPIASQDGRGTSTTSAGPMKCKGSRTPESTDIEPTHKGTQSTPGEK
eukprot:8457721-Prorocentrum_lima.AAC.1